MNAKYVFYGDLNCPFCHAQNERLIAFGAEPKVEWRGVQHAPHLPVPTQTPSQAEREHLEREVITVQQREPSVTIRMPRARPNTEAATLLVAAAMGVDPSLATTLKTLLYRALWVLGRDISDPRVLDDLRRTAGLPRLDITAHERLAISVWQREWEMGEFDRRIPSLKSPKGAHILGLDERRRVEAFLKSGILSSESDEVCGK